MAQEIRRWDIIDGPPLSDLLASLAACRTYTSEFKFKDPVSGVKFYCFAEVWGLSRFSDVPDLPDPSRDSWTITLQVWNCEALDRTHLTRGIAPPLHSFLQGGYSFGSRRTGSVRRSQNDPQAM